MNNKRKVKEPTILLRSVIRMAGFPFIFLPWITLQPEGFSEGDE